VGRDTRCALLWAGGSSAQDRPAGAEPDSARPAAEALLTGADRIGLDRGGRRSRFIPAPTWRGSPD
jgi:hypothetical protein